MDSEHEICSHLSPNWFYPMLTSKVRTQVVLASEVCLVNLILRKSPLSLLPKSGSRLHRLTHSKVLEDAS